MRNRKWLVITGIFAGLMLASKFSLIMFACAMAILVVLHSLKSDQRLSSLISALFMFAIAALTVWGVYAFQISPIDLGGCPFLHLASGVNGIGTVLPQPTMVNYLFGQTSTTGWWYYFPITLTLRRLCPC
jgi:4-amino-4-deoxy-L-arabinose transferase-like glycosyltransferase